MCGFAGIFRWDSKPIESELLKRMTQTLVHRGPDDEGYYISPESRVQSPQVGLGFRRLSIIDLSGGHQPMGTQDQKIWIVFNGEIYNFLELRKDLETRGCRFQSRSDTEVILHLYEIFGTECVQYLRGMFAFAIWDSKKRKIFLARDRIGKKPLFYARTSEVLYFASEMKALLEVEEIPRTMNLQAIPLYLTYQFIPSPQTIFEKIQRLPPAHTLVCDEQGKLTIQRYWKISRKPQKAKRIEEFCEELREILREATKIRLISDVPLGAFLSGGMDSSAVVGMMAQEMSEPVKTFSIGFEESDFSELAYAKLVAKKFATDHHEFIVQPQMAEILPKLVWHYDQPFADPSALPSYYVARETKKHVTVALNGDGGDENFGGYLRYQADRIFQTIAILPRPLRKILSQLSQRTFTTAPWNPQGNLWELPSWRNSHLARRIAKASSLLDAEPLEFNFKLFCYFDGTSATSIFEEPLLQAANSFPPYDYFSGLYNQSDSEELLDKIFACDAYGYLPDCLLVKMDIASMANSLEARSPFLDHKLIEFAATIPANLKVKYTGGKWILKKALKNFLPEEILRRRKMGFGLPLARWFRGPLKSFLRETILNERARQRGFFKRKAIDQMVGEHENGIRDHGYQLWALMMFELWNQVFVDKGL